MADQGDEIEHIHVSSDDINPYVSDDELRITFDDGNHSADEDELNATNSSLAYLTQVRKARKKASDVAPSRTCTVRMIACTGFGFLIICLAMVGVSLVMSKDIDSLGKRML